jgi:hypothetical protein
MWLVRIALQRPYTFIVMSMLIVILVRIGNPSLTDGMAVEVASDVAQGPAPATGG